jgi:sec-independent protein translocase protein TatA
MGLFGLGAPELAIIAGVALLVLGPEQVKKLAKDVGKVSAELKQVPEEFSKGMEMGKEELESKKGSKVPPTDQLHRPAPSFLSPGTLASHV